MARSTMEVAFLGTQKVAFNQNGNDVKIVKVFYGDEADGETENGLSIVSMDVPLEVADEVFASGANFQPLELVRITFEVARAGKQKGNNLCVHIESAKPGTQASKPATPQGQQTSKPAPGVQPEPGKAN
ncbi:hypothetical protein [Stutzerimonas nitrititolerans]|uniref:hypothetical protein n=1 Tax=Stutzerimonas nitrititolerans TaxID=2482751 RepID=UPI0028A8FA20|nr:hypothetical protein [Stutzerimonas nitrititolerans]